MTKNSLKNGPDEFGYYGEFGSRYAPEILMPNLIELEKAFDRLEKVIRERKECPEKTGEFGAELITLQNEIDD